MHICLLVLNLVHIPKYIHIMKMLDKVVQKLEFTVKGLGIGNDDICSRTPTKSTSYHFLFRTAQYNFYNLLVSYNERTTSFIIF